MEDSYLWAYKVKIKNDGNDTVKLISRHWKIFDSNGSFKEVKGKGVVGEQPVLEPGEEFEYTSGTPLKTSSGLMHGSYQMEDYDGKEFEVLIPPFSLDIPNKVNKLN
jgi:ApaG protein